MPVHPVAFYTSQWLVIIHNVLALIAISIDGNKFLHDAPFNDMKIITNEVQFFVEEICFVSHIEKG
jgi:hypothetical protein